MSNIHETNNEEIIFTENVPNGLRIFLVLIGVIPTFVAPYKFLQPHWGEFSLYFVFLVIVSIGAILLGGMFIVAGVFGLNQKLQIKIKSKTILYSYESAFFPLRKTIYKFSDVSNIEIKTRNWQEGHSTYGLQFNFNNGQTIETYTFEKQAEAELYLSKVKNLIR
ncbi:MAG: hypothetical protein L6Q29_05060 [Candidatus Pacebacteria bacterium]|nr:hypothetical protein [Candidatus Paceibacterota bacterium]